MPCNELHCLAMLSVMDETIIPRLEIKQNNLTHRTAALNLHLQMEEWAFKQHSSGDITDKNTEAKLKNLVLVKQPEIKYRLMSSLATEIERLAQGILDIKGTNSIYFIIKSEIPQEKLKESSYGRFVVDYKPNKAKKNS